MRYKVYENEQVKVDTDDIQTAGAAFYLGIEKCSKAVVPTDDFNYSCELRDEIDKMFCRVEIRSGVYSDT